MLNGRDLPEARLSRTRHTPQVARSSYRKINLEDLAPLVEVKSAEPAPPPRPPATPHPSVEVKSDAGREVKVPEPAIAVAGLKKPIVKPRTDYFDAKVYSANREAHGEEIKELSSMPQTNRRSY